MVEGARGGEGMVLGENVKFQDVIRRELCIKEEIFKNFANICKKNIFCLNSNFMLPFVNTFSILKICKGDWSMCFYLNLLNTKSRGKIIFTSIFFLSVTEISLKSIFMFI